MNRSTFGLAAAVAGMIAAPGLASALSAVTSESTDLRAGPAYDFPVVDRIPSDVRVNVHGCVRGYRWCDVSWRDTRGWMPGQELAYLYQNRRVRIVEYGPRIGLPLVAFSFDTYWGRHYRSRPWYSERSRWRTVWRDRDDRDTRDRTGAETGRTSDGRRDDHSERRLERRGGRNERPDVRTGRGDWRDRGETRAYRPDTPTPRQDMDRAVRKGGPNPGERSAPAMRERGPGGGERGSQRGGQDGPDRGQSDRGR
jgi:uncharacterized protein YraI